MNKDALKHIEALEMFHHPAMTVIEEGLKRCREARPDIQDRVLSAKEMADYMLWMAENYGQNKVLKPDGISLPPILQSGGIALMGQKLLINAKDKESREKLSALIQSPAESSFFLEAQDISAGIFLRYLPAYWRADEYFEVYYSFSGICHVFFEREELELKAGDVVIIPPGIKKACTCSSDDSKTCFYMIRKSTFSQVFWEHLNAQNLMSHFFRQALSGESRTPYLRFETGCDLRLESLLYTINREYEQNRKYGAALMNSLMSSFFLFLLQEHEDKVQISRHSDFSWKPEYAALLTELESGFATVTLEKLASKYGYSRRQLIRIIQSCTGSSFTAIQTRMRMEKAARMLKARTASVDEIAYEVGFSDRTSFYRAFRIYYGCTPKQFINK